MALLVGVFTALAIGNLVTTEHSTPPTMVGQSLTETILDSIRTGGEDAIAEGTLPSWFEEEFFPTDGYFNFHCNGDGTVMGASSALPAEATLGPIKASMEAKGWTALSSGDPSVVTMVRTEGRHPWALIWAQDMGGQSTIIVQTLPCE